MMLHSLLLLVTIFLQMEWLYYSKFLTSLYEEEVDEEEEEAREMGRRKVFKLE